MRIPPRRPLPPGSPVPRRGGPLASNYALNWGASDVVPAGSRKTIVKNEGITEWQDDNPAGADLTVFVQARRAQAPLPDDCIPRAILRWGSGGSQVSATVDVLGGARLVVACAAMEVIAWNEGSPGGAPWTFSVTLGYGSPGVGSGIQPATYTERALVLTPGSPVRVAVPEFAKTATVFVSDPTVFAAPGVRLDVQQIDGPAIPPFPTSIYNATTPAAYPITVPLAGSTQAIRLLLTGAVPNQKAWVVWGLIL